MRLRISGGIIGFAIYGFCGRRPYSTLAKEREGLHHSSLTVLVHFKLFFHHFLWPHSLRGFLHDADFEILEAKDGKEALDLAKIWTPDMILLDMKMPVMDGYVAAEILKQDDATKDIPVIAVTASALVQDEEKIRNICTDYMRKPMRKKDLVLTMMKYLPHRQVERDSGSMASNIGSVSGEGIDLDKVPEEKKEKLIQAASHADIGRLNELIVQVAEFNPSLSALLQGYADNFNYKQIINTVAFNGEKSESD